MRDELRGRALVQRAGAPSPRKATKLRGKASAKQRPHLGSWVFFWVRVHVLLFFNWGREGLGWLSTVLGFWGGVDDGVWGFGV